MLRWLAALLLCTLLPVGLADVTQTLPEWIVEVDWGRDGNWVDVSTTVVDGEEVGRIRDLTWQRGKNDEYGRYEAGTSTITLDNRDRWLEAGWVGSPWWPDVKPSRLIRIRARWDPDADPVFTGLIESIPPAWEPSGSEASVTITASDRFTQIAGGRRPPSVYDLEVRAAPPKARYRLGETSGTVAADSSGNANHGDIEGGAAFNARAGLIAYDADGAIAFDGVDDAIVVPSGPTTVALTISAWIQMDTVTEPSTYVIYEQGPWATGGPERMYIGVNGYFDADLGASAGRFKAKVGDAFAASTTRVDDGEIHHVAATRTAAGVMAVYVDGVDVTTSNGDGSTIMPPSGLIGSTSFSRGSGESVPPGSPDIPFLGTIDEVELYESALSAARIAELYEAGTDPWAGDTTGERITKLLELAGLGPTEMDVDAGLSTLTATGLGSNLLELVQAVADSEQGDFFITADGVARFRDRGAAYDDARSVAVQAVFGDRWDSLDELPYLSVEPAFDIDQVINSASVTPANGSAILIEDDDSIDEHGHRTADRSVDVEDPDLARDYASWLVSSYAQPQPRYRKLTVAPAFDPDRLWPIGVALDIGDRVAFRKHPPGGGDPVDIDAMIIGKGGSSPAGSATIEFTLGPVALDPFAWADDVDGSGPGLGWDGDGAIGGVWTY